MKRIGEQKKSLEELLRTAPKAKPQFVEPMKCKLVAALPKDRNWLYELKYDGYRALAIKRGKTVELFSRNRKDLSARFPGICDSLAALPCDTATLDGEVVALEAGRPSFQALQNVGQPGRHSVPILYYAFDLLHWEGRDLTGLPIEARRMLLAQLMKKPPAHVCFSRGIQGAAAAILSGVKAQGLEGLIGKKSGSRYEAGQRSGSWIKYKVLNEQEFVIGGYTFPKGSREAFGAVLVGFYQGGQLRYASKVGTGFSDALLRQLLRKFQPLIQKACPFVNLPEKQGGRWGEGLTASELRKCVWLKPQLVCQIGFTEWTHGDHLRHPVFKGLREDKKPEEVVRESA